MNNRTPNEEYLSGNSSNVSVIIPCHNGAAFLAEAIESALSQTIPALEVIVIDDGSTDATADVVACYPQVQYVYQQQQGVSVARNLGLKLSQGEYIVFLDHDDRLMPEALEIGLEAFCLHPNSGFVFGTCKNINANGTPVQASNRSVLERPYELPIYPSILKGNSIHPPARHLIHRSVFEQIGGFDTSLVVAEDYDLYLRMAAAFPGYCHNQPIVEYREHQASASSTARSSQHLLASLKVLHKQREFVRRNRVYKSAYQLGKQHWCQIYSRYLAYDIITYLKAGQPQKAGQALSLLLRYYPQGLVHYGIEQLSKRLHWQTSAKSRQSYQQ
jgi:glycosyltransferase involved in cell wall biosynthesis